MSAARLPRAAVACLSAAAPAQLLRRTTPNACGRIAASAGLSGQRLVANILARGAVATADASTTSNDGQGKYFLFATGMLTLGGSSSGDETVECAPPKWSNGHQRLLMGSIEAGSAAPGPMNDSHGDAPVPRIGRGDVMDRQVAGSTSSAAPEPYVPCDGLNFSDLFGEEGQTGTLSYPPVPELPPVSLPLPPHCCRARRGKFDVIVRRFNQS